MTGKELISLYMGADKVEVRRIDTPYSNKIGEFWVRSVKRNTYIQKGLEKKVNECTPACFNVTSDGTLVLYFYRAFQSEVENDN